MLYGLLPTQHIILIWHRWNPKLKIYLLCKRNIPISPLQDMGMENGPKANTMNDEEVITTAFSSYQHLSRILLHFSLAGCSSAKFAFIFRAPSVLAYWATCWRKQICITSYFTLSSFARWFGKVCWCLSSLSKPNNKQVWEIQAWHHHNGTSNMRALGVGEKGTLGRDPITSMWPLASLRMMPDLSVCGTGLS